MSQRRMMARPIQPARRSRTQPLGALAAVVALVAVVAVLAVGLMAVLNLLPGGKGASPGGSSAVAAIPTAPAGDAQPQARRTRLLPAQRSRRLLNQQPHGRAGRPHQAPSPLPCRGERRSPRSRRQAAERRPAQPNSTWSARSSRSGSPSDGRPRTTTATTSWTPAKGIPTPTTTRVSTNKARRFDCTTARTSTPTAANR